MRKRFLATLLALAMVLSVTPFALAAGEDGQDTVAIVRTSGGQETGYPTLHKAMQAATAGSTVVLQQDVSVTSTSSTKNFGVTVDLNGHNINGEALAADKPALELKTNYGSKPVEGVDSTLRLINSKAPQGGTVTAKLPVRFQAGDSQKPVSGEIGDGVTLIVSDGGVTAVELISSAYLLYNETAAQYVSNGGFRVSADGQDRIYGTYANAAKVAAGNTITMLNDYTGSTPLNSGNATSTLDLNHKTYIYTGTKCIVEINYDNAGLTLMNGTLKCEQSAVDGIQMLYSNTSLTLDNITLDVPGTYGIVTNGNEKNNSITLKDSALTVENGSGIYFPSTGSVTIENSKVSAKNVGVQMCAGSLTVEGEQTTITATGTPQTKTENDGVIPDAAAVSIVEREGYQNLGTITIEAGTFEATESSKAVKAYAFNNTNKTEDDWVGANEVIAITGGAFSTPIPVEYCADNFAPLVKSDGTYGVVDAENPPDGYVRDEDGNYYESAETAAETNEASVTTDDETIYYPTFAEAIAAAESASKPVTITLLQNITEEVSISEGQEITLDLNGETLSTTDDHTISNHGTLTVIDSVGTGKVENNVEGKGALANYPGATATLKGGTFTGNDWYVIKNLGTMTIEDGTTVDQQDTGSSGIDNGWYNHKNNDLGLDYPSGTSVEEVHLTITGGTFTGGMNTVKNDDYGNLKISGGTFSNTDGPTVLNWNVAEISGGDFTVNNSASSVIANGYLNETADKGELTITGGTFTASNGGTGVLFGYGAGSAVSGSGTVSLEGGTFIGRVITDSSYPYTPVVTGGDYSQSVDPKYLDESMTAELKKASGAAPYSYYTSVEAAAEYADAGDEIKDLSSEEENPDPIVVHEVTLKSEGWTDTVQVLGDTYVLPAAPTRPGYVFGGWQGSDGKIYDANETVTVSGNMTFTAQWSVYVAPNPSYLVLVSQAEGGSVTANPTAAKKGDTVTLTVTPEDGYELEELTVTDFWGKDVALTDNGDGTYSFTMPGSQVEIEATFTQTGEPELPFTDVTEADWFYDEVQYVVDNGLMIGVSDTEFAPGADLTRAMLWTILARMDGETITGANWAQDARAWAMDNGVSDGTDADRAVTREQLAAMLYRYAQFKGYDMTASGDLSGFADGDTVSGWAEEAMSWSVGAGLIQGDENGLTPTATAIRAQIAAILMRFCENVAK